MLVVRIFWIWNKKIKKLYSGADREFHHECINESSYQPKPCLTGQYWMYYCVYLNYLLCNLTRKMIKRTFIQRIHFFKLFHWPFNERRNDYIFWNFVKCHGVKDVLTVKLWATTSWYLTQSCIMFLFKLVYVIEDKQFVITVLGFMSVQKPPPLSGRSITTKRCFS